MKSILLGVTLLALSAIPALAATGPAPQAAAFEDAQMAASSRAAVAFAQTAVRAAAGDPELAALIRQRQEAEDRWLAIDEERAGVLGKSGEKERARATALDTLQAETLAEVRRADAEIARRYPIFADLVSPAPLPLDEVQKLLGPSEALVLILPASDATYVWAVRRETTSWTRADLTARALEDQVRRIRAGLDLGADVRAAVDAAGETSSRNGVFSRQEAYDLYRRLWAPSEAVLKGASTVYVVAAGPLSALPFSVLVTAPPKGDDADPRALRRTPWLIKRHALATLPSVSSLRLLSRLEAASAGKVAFAGYGDPALGGAPSLAAPGDLRGFYRSGGVADAKAVSSLPRLPNTRPELEAIARALGAPPTSVTVGEAATERSVKSADLSQVRVLAFATHGLLAGEIGGLNEPALVLTPPAEVKDAEDDGLLTASEASRLRLNADWIVLSACNTAGGDGPGGLSAGGEGLSGLARAFFHAGGRALLVSNWRVRDDAAARLTTVAIQHHARAPAAGKPEALRQAMLALMADSRVPDGAQPSTWAPFVVVGR